MQQEQKFTFKVCCQLLQISPKSFLGWLKKAGIDPEKQRDRFDPRKKYLYRDQLDMLAAAHGRKLPSRLDDFAEAASTAVVTIEMLAGQLATLRQQFDQIGQIVLQLPPRLEEIATNLREVRQVDVDALIEPLIQRFDHLELVIREQIALQQAITTGSATAAPEPAKAEAAATRVAKPSPRRVASTSQAKTKAKKKPARGKKLPRAFVALRDFAKQHNIQMERASQAGKAGKIAVVRGKWLVNSRWATEALDEQGQYDFYECFQSHESFVSCAQCPHLVAGSSRLNAM